MRSAAVCLTNSERSSKWEYVVAYTIANHLVTTRSIPKPNDGAEDHKGHSIHAAWSSTRKRWLKCWLRTDSSGDYSELEQLYVPDFLRRLIHNVTTNSMVHIPRIPPAVPRPTARRSDWLRCTESPRHSGPSWWLNSGRLPFIHTKLQSELTFKGQSPMMMVYVLLMAALIISKECKASHSDVLPNATRNSRRDFPLLKKTIALDLLNATFPSTPTAFPMVSVVNVAPDVSWNAKYTSVILRYSSNCKLYLPCYRSIGHPLGLFESWESFQTLKHHW